MLLGAKGGSGKTLFDIFSAGVKTNRDAICYNSSPTSLQHVISKQIEFFNTVGPEREKIGSEEDFKWCQKTIDDHSKGRRYSLSTKQIRKSLYRPFFGQWLYEDSRLNWSGYLMRQLFPIGFENRAIMVTGPGAQDFSCLMTDTLPCHDLMAKGQCFPLSYLVKGSASSGLFQTEEEVGVRHAVSEMALTSFRATYPETKINKDDLFYYVYGLLHSAEYRERYADNLSKELPRIPMVKGAENFRAFVDAGRRLGDLHVSYETVEPYPVTIAQGDLRLANIPEPQAFYRVEQMKFAGKRPKLDKTTVIYNGSITMTGIPLDAYEYVVNGKPALEWVMERQCVKTDKASGIVNDANRYAIETVGDPAYPLLLFQRMITVSLETVNIVRSLPPLDIQEGGGAPG